MPIGILPLLIICAGFVIFCNIFMIYMKVIEVTNGTYLKNPMISLSKNRIEKQPLIITSGSLFCWEKIHFFYAAKWLMAPFHYFKCYHTYFFTFCVVEIIQYAFSLGLLPVWVSGPQCVCSHIFSHIGMISQHYNTYCITKS